MSEKFSPPTQSLYKNTRNRFCVYADVLPEFTSGIRALFNLVIDVVIEIALSSSDNSGISIGSNKNLSDLECADEVVLLNEDSTKLQVFLARLNGS